MVEYLLDTSIIIELFRGNDNIINKINDSENKNVNFSITYITLCELYKGAYLHSKKEDKLKEVAELASSSEIINFDILSCKLFGEMYNDLRKKGILIPESDLMIASISKRNGMILATKDKKHFEKLGIDVEQW